MSNLPQQHTYVSQSQSPHVQQQQPHYRHHPSHSNVPQPQQPQHPYHPRTKIVAGYALQEILGSGSFATVYKGIQVATTPPSTTAAATTTTTLAPVAAIKAISRTSSKLTPKVLANLDVEISILRTYQHPHIVCLHTVLKTPHHVYLVLEYCAGGDVQGLIRSRARRRLSEGLVRRLLRDLASGLGFLWKRELIHRDIKPQNLLLTGPLPVEEVAENAPAVGAPRSATTTTEANTVFSLKIADFGFARHLQSASLAETLCGSPLYMAPEILQHQRYDAKADLWSVGTVLFEMIAGEPPFTGENHIDLLRNIQRKAVRLPKDVRVSKEGVHLLRILLSRNPLSRAGFPAFFAATEAFCALGCHGVATPGDQGGLRPRPSMDLGTIPENDGSPPRSTSDGTGDTTYGTNAVSPSQSLLTVATTTMPAAGVSGMEESTVPGVGPPLSPVPAPIPPMPVHHTNHPQTKGHVLSPLEHSPPPSSGIPYMPQPQMLHPAAAAALPELPTITAPTMPVAIEMPTRRNENEFTLQSSTDESSFVMVDNFGSTNKSPESSTAVAVVSQHASVGGAAGIAGNDYQRQPSSYNRHHQLEPSPPSPGFWLSKKASKYLVSKPSQQQPQKSASSLRGMLSTSPGTGGALLGMLTGKPQLLTSQPVSVVKPNHHTNTKLVDSRLKTATKVLATSQDVGRRAISVAHLGDKRAYVAMRLLMLLNESIDSSVLSSTPMEGIEEEGEEHHNVDSGTVTDDASSTEIMTSAVRRRRSSSSATDRSMADAAHKSSAIDVSDMPFAVPTESSLAAPPVGLPTRSASVSFHRDSQHAMITSSGGAGGSGGIGGGSGVGNDRPVRPTPAIVQAHFREALACYLKALKMLKAAVSAAEGVVLDLDAVGGVGPTSEQTRYTDELRDRSKVTLTWLGSQFRGVLERGDAANVEIGKLPVLPKIIGVGVSGPGLTSIEELLYNNALIYGREGAVKQLLGHYEAARSCFRSAGLLAETLLMEQTIVGDDRKTLEGYVDGFAVQINELDDLMLQQQGSQQQSRAMASSNVMNSVLGSRRWSNPHPSAASPSHPFAVDQVQQQKPLK